MQGLNFHCIMSHSLASIYIDRGDGRQSAAKKNAILLCVICGCFLFAQHDVYIFLYKLIPKLTVCSIFSIYIYTRSYVLLRVCISESKTSSILSILSKKNYVINYACFITQQNTKAQIFQEFRKRVHQQLPFLVCHYKYC